MDKIEEIKKLQALLEQDAISEEEFKLLKQKVINQDSNPVQYSENVSQSPQKVERKEKTNNKFSEEKKTSRSGKKKVEFQERSEFTLGFLKLIWGLSLILGVIFWYRYDSFIAFLVATILSIGLSIAIVRLIPKLLSANLLLVSMSLLIFLFIGYPIGNIHEYSSTSESSSNSSVAYNKCKFCRKVRTAGSNESLHVYTIEPDGIGLVSISSGSRSGFCSERCAIAYRSIPDY